MTDRERVTCWLRRAANGLGLWAILVQHGLLPPAIVVAGTILGIIGVVAAMIAGNLMVAAVAITAASFSLTVALALLLVRVSRRNEDVRQADARAFRAALLELTKACR